MTRRVAFPALVDELRSSNILIGVLDFNQVATEEMYTELKKSSQTCISHVWYSVQKLGNRIFAPIQMNFLMHVACTITKLVGTI